MQASRCTPFSAVQMKSFTYNQKFPCDDSCFVKLQNDSSRPPTAVAARGPSLASMTLPSTAADTGGLLERIITPEVCFLGTDFAVPSLASGGGEAGLVRSSSGSCSGILWVGTHRRGCGRTAGIMNRLSETFLHGCVQALYHKTAPNRLTVHMYWRRDEVPQRISTSRESHHPATRHTTTTTTATNQKHNSSSTLLPKIRQP